MTNEKNMENLLSELKYATEVLTKNSIESTDLLVNSYKEIFQDHVELLEDYIKYIASDVIDSYDKLIQLRKECIDKYIGVYTRIMQNDDEFDIIKPMKSLMEKQQEDIERWQQEIAPLIELKNANDETSDEKSKEILEMFKNI